MSFAKDKHIRFWRMCSQSLPDHYMGNDGSRMTLGFFTLSALDLLGALESIDVQERQSWISWIYSCQVPGGGFRGFTGTHLGKKRSVNNDQWDPANVPATFFALATLLLLGDDLSLVDRQACLIWLPKLQRDNGCFGDLLSEGGTIEGDNDLRQCCCAAGIAYMLQDPKESQPIFNEDKLIDYVQSCQSWSGGFSVSPLKEPHSGLSYCGVATLSFVQRLRGCASQDVLKLIPDGPLCLRWFLGRQTDCTGSDDETDDVGPERQSSSNESCSATSHKIKIAGFNGRDGKVADTCYAFWNTGALAILGKESLADTDAMINYLLEVTQHRIGGFGKGKGDPPDVLHAYLGLAALAANGFPELQALDSTFCMSVSSVARLERLGWKAHV